MKFFVFTVMIVLIGFGVAWAGGQTGKFYQGYSIFVICAGVAFLMNWLAFIPAFLRQTEKFYDVVGSLTYISVIVSAVYLSAKVSPLDHRGWIVAAMVSIWALRLGSFLFIRIQREGRDQRFDHIKTRPSRFFLAWTLQALWVVLTSACAVVILTSHQQMQLGVWAYMGMVLWIFGFSIEVIADYQKSSFRKAAANKGQFIQTGLWAWSRHPNYFGEIILWTGIAFMAVPVMSGWQYICLVSPLFVFFLLTKISGIPTLARVAAQRWGHDPNYQAYVEKTPLLWPRPPH